MPLETLSDDRRSHATRVTESSLYLVLLAESERPDGTRHRLSGLAEIAIGRADRRTVKRDRQRLAIGLADDRMSRAHATLREAKGGFTIVDAGSRNGTLVNGELVTGPTELADGDLIELGRSVFVVRELADDDVLPHDCDAATLARRSPEIASFCPELLVAAKGLRKLAPTTVPILLRGESGTGKEVLARAIHAASGRSGPFIAVNCGALPETLVESELFGHKKGAFSGALADKPGLARAAHGGTLFLDEIGDLAPASQAALLRVLQEREVVPIGGTQPIPIDIKLVSATHRDLAAMGDAAFRRDLYARIAGFTLALPALRDRREDLGLLVGALLERVAPNTKIACEAMRSIVAHDWPLNVRELDSALRVAAALAEAGTIALNDLPEAIRELGAIPPTLSEEDRRQRDYVVDLLRQHGGNVSAAARASGKARMQIQRWMRRFAIDPSAYKR